MADVSAAEFDRLLSETLDALKPGAKEGAPDEQAREPLRGHGEALDGLVRVTAGPGARLSEVTVEPKALRAGSEELSAAILEAVNAALAELQTRLAAELPAGPDTGAIGAQLRELQDRSVRQLASFLDAVEDLRVQVSSRKGRADGG